ncbi:MAG: toxin-antitoxin system HicB family antitoxin [Spirochaetota bacterium]
MAHRNTLTIRVPEELKERIETVAAQQGISINQFAMYAFAKEIEEMETGRALRKIARGVDKKKLFRRIDELFARVPDRDVPEWDRVDGAR